LITRYSSRSRVQVLEQIDFIVKYAGPAALFSPGDLKKQGNTTPATKKFLKLSTELRSIYQEESPVFQSFFDGDLDPKKICSELEIRTGIDINEKKTLMNFAGSFAQFGFDLGMIA